jgi:hypothetical protein
MLSALFSRRPADVADLGAASALRPSRRARRDAVCPPEAPRTRWLAAARAWLTQGCWPAVETSPWQPPQADRRHTTLAIPQIKQEFADSVCDLATPQGADLLDRIHFARSMHELWHLRADIYSLVAVHHSQEEAEERLTWLNRHFPTRSPRSGFGALTSRDLWP